MLLYCYNCRLMEYVLCGQVKNAFAEQKLKEQQQQVEDEAKRERERLDELRKKEQDRIMEVRITCPFLVIVLLQRVSASVGRIAKGRKV